MEVSRRLEAATVAGTKTFSYLKFVGGGVLTLSSNASITVRGNMDTVNVVLGNNAIFKADTGSTMMIARDSAFVFGSGSKLEIAGLLRTTYGNYTTIPYGSTLRIRPGAVLQWGTYGSLVIEGTLSAIGTASNPITITKGPDELVPSGIHLLGASVDTIEHCKISELNTGIEIGNCVVRIRNNQFVNCGTAIYSDAYHHSPLIEGNTIDSCSIGLDVYTSSTIGVPTIQTDTIRACTYGMIMRNESGNGLQRPTLAGAVEQIQLPVQFNLAQNYPNPFNPLTTIKYDLPRDEHVTLKIYDILGREVRTLVNEFVKAGYQQVTFNANELASGVYFYRMQAGNVVSLKRMLLLK